MARSAPLMASAQRRVTQAGIGASLDRQVARHGGVRSISARGPQPARVSDIAFRASPSASIGSGATIAAGVEVGEWALVGSHSVVSRDVEAYAVVYGVPAKPAGWRDRASLSVDPT